MGVGLIVGPVSDWTTIYPGHKGHDMNNRQREVAAKPWVLSYKSGPCSYQSDDNENLSKKADGYLQWKGEDTGTYGNMIPHTIVDYKDGIPVSVYLYNPEENHALYLQSEKGYKQTRENYESFNETYSAYNPVVTYLLPNQSYWSSLKNENDTSVIVKSVEEFVASSEMVDIVEFKDPFKKKGFWENIRNIFSTENKIEAPKVIKHIRNDFNAIEFR